MLFSDSCDLADTPGVAKHAFDVDQIEQAMRLEQRLQRLIDVPESKPAIPSWSRVVELPGLKPRLKYQLACVQFWVITPRSKSLLSTLDRKLGPR